MGILNNRALQGVSSKVEFGAEGLTLENLTTFLKLANTAGVMVPVRHGNGVDANDSATVGQLQAAVDALVDSSPATLDTLREISEFFQSSDDTIAANLVSLGAELNQDVVDLCALLGITENATNYTTEFDGGVIRANPKLIEAITDLNVNLKTIVDNIGTRNATADGISLDSGKLRAATVNHDVLSVNIGPAFADDNFLTRCVVKVTEAFSSGCGSLTISGFGSVDEADLGVTQTIVLDAGTRANNFVDGSYQGVAVLDGTCVAGKAIVHIESIAV